MEELAVRLERLSRSRSRRVRLSVRGKKSNSVRVTAWTFDRAGTVMSLGTKSFPTEDAGTKECA